MLVIIATPLADYCKKQHQVVTFPVDEEIYKEIIKLKNLARASRCCFEDYLL
jgi:hypothetical protein